MYILTKNSGAIAIKRTSLQDKEVSHQAAVKGGESKGSLLIATVHAYWQNCQSCWTESFLWPRVHSTTSASWEMPCCYWDISTQTPKTIKSDLPVLSNWAHQSNHLEQQLPFTQTWYNALYITGFVFEYTLLKVGKGFSISFSRICCYHPFVITFNLLQRMLMNFNIWHTYPAFR